jgi:hypothetical protein
MMVSGGGATLRILNVQIMGISVYRLPWALSEGGAVLGVGSICMERIRKL